MEGRVGRGRSDDSQCTRDLDRFCGDAGGNEIISAEGRSADVCGGVEMMHQCEEQDEEEEEYLCCKSSHFIRGKRIERYKRR